MLFALQFTIYPIQNKYQVISKTQKLLRTCLCYAVWQIFCVVEFSQIHQCKFFYTAHYCESEFTRASNVLEVIQKKTLAKMIMDEDHLAPHKGLQERNEFLSEPAQ